MASVAWTFSTGVLRGHEGSPLVIGDVMVDAYLWGRVDRISPEAPVPVVQVTERSARLGGAANVALNLKALGANPVVISVIGDDVLRLMLHLTAALILMVADYRGGYLERDLGDELPAGVNQLDEKIRIGEFKQILPYKLPLTLGHDVAGTVLRVGAAVRGFRPGDEVYARPRDHRIGTFAERIAIDEADAAPNFAQVVPRAEAAKPADKPGE